MNYKNAATSGAFLYFGKICSKHPDSKGERYTCNSRCIVCARDMSKRESQSENGAARRAAYARLPERKAKMAIFKKRYNQSERGKARQAIWNARRKAKNPEKERARIAAWYAANPGKHQLHRRNRRIKEKVGQLSSGLPKKLLALQNGKCAACRSFLNGVFHLDHVLSLFLGGEHHDNNIQLLCPQCNLSKNSKHPIDFMRSMGFLL